jgi:hypothetical protein
VRALSSQAALPQPVAQLPAAAVVDSLNRKNHMHPLLLMMKKRAQVTWAGWAVAGVALAAIPISNYFTLQTAMGQIRFYAMDERNTYYVSSLGTFYDAQAYRREACRMAATAIFTRRPDGFEHPELLDRIFWPVAAKVVRDEADKDADQFKAQIIHQHCETGPMTEINKDNNSTLVSVEVQVMREYVFNQRLLNNVQKATLFLLLKLNPSMDTNGQYPLVVYSYKIRYDNERQNVAAVR